MMQSTSSPTNVVAEVDYYQTLGISRGSNDKQIGAAYKALMLKYHPDRNPGDEEAVKSYKAVCEAYSVLIDPSRRRAYDVGGNKALSGMNGGDPNSPVTSPAASEGKHFGIGKVFEAVISKLGVPTSTAQQALAVSPEFIDTAQKICRSGGLDGDSITLPAELSQPPNKVFVSDIAWADAAIGRVEKHGGVYYRIVVDKAHVEAGFTISIKSSSKDKFKAVLFDDDGSVVYQVSTLVFT
jgi:curved DNA-binding protein CbpA